MLVASFQGCLGQLAWGWSGKGLRTHAALSDLTVCEMLFVNLIVFEVVMVCTAKLVLEGHLNIRTPGCGTATPSPTVVA